MLAERFTSGVDGDPPDPRSDRRKRTDPKVKETNLWKSERYNHELLPDQYRSHQTTDFGEAYQLLLQRKHTSTIRSMQLSCKKSANVHVDSSAHR